MNPLRDRWRRTAFARYFEGLEPFDRATFWIVAGLALAVGISAPPIILSAIGDADDRPAMVLHHASCGGGAC